MVGRRFAFARPDWIEANAKDFDQLSWDAATVEALKACGLILFHGEQADSLSWRAGGLLAGRPDRGRTIHPARPHLVHQRSGALSRRPGACIDDPLSDSTCSACSSRRLQHRIPVYEQCQALFLYTRKAPGQLSRSDRGQALQQQEGVNWREPDLQQWPCLRPDWRKRPRPPSPVSPCGEERRASLSDTPLLFRRCRARQAPNSRDERSPVQPGTAGSP